MSEDNPCVGICEIQDGYCIGCGRSADELFGDSDSDTGEPDAVVESVAPVPGPQNESD